MSGSVRLVVRGASERKPSIKIGVRSHSFPGFKMEKNLDEPRRRETDRPTRRKEEREKTGIGEAVLPAL